ncbi:MAG: hypothetical protein JWS10_959 [Cypionkella sp.]|uniref:hypothetical protein n=1 Tax=Cypionkella sp. TaxID=2811411 RepID=UPI0026062379|nr:hypothetical protein [Cypionkella sp.]MDB5658344.1 hypothetical protein [Cypionkella sp.]
MSGPTYTSADALAKAEAAWTVALRLQQFVFANISFEVSTTIPHAMHIVKGWEAEGKVRRISPPKGRRASKLNFEVIPEGEIRIAPVVGDAYEQMWTIMRKSRGFSPPDLLSMCSVPLTLEEAGSYCRLLLTADYLRVVQKAIPPTKPAIYRLINATGIKAPRGRRLQCIVDPNLGTATPLAEVGQ